ncbi:hypothetical protein G7046_g6346 [Stylonectria norvegica]|nr:hypothetical protein G7046_g6346 [Stylonectria norvegica]
MCQRIGVECTGYGVKFIWVKDDGSVGTSQGRRALPCESTWNGFGHLAADMVDLLIFQCDEETDLDKRISTTFSTSSNIADHNPFSVFKVDAQLHQRYQPLSLIQEPDTTSDLMLPVPTTFPEWPVGEQFLFHHYVSHVANIMMPYEHPRNPWKSHFPAAALEMASLKHNFLYSAMLAHAAFNIAQLRGNDDGFLRVGLKQYGDAIQALVHSIGQESLDFPAAMASIMTLMFAELYHGPSHSWRHHFEGACTLLGKHSNSEPWKSTDLACVSLQSLSIVKIIGDTSKSSEVGFPLEETSLTEASPISFTSGFGFTIGAPKLILDSIARITTYKNRRSHGLTEDDDVSQLLARELALLSQFGNKRDMSYNVDSENSVLDLDAIVDQDTTPEAAHQRGAFVEATYIYLYRSLLDASPKAVNSYVGRTFAHVSAFFANSNGNFSVWPAFIAAAEAYTDHDLQVARQWLESATSFGIGSRKLMKLVLEEIWRRRDAMSRESGLERGLIAVDWRAVMEELDCDILLV